MNYLVCLRHCLLLVILSWGIASCEAQNNPLADLKELSSAKYEGRGQGTPGNKRAAKYIAVRFAEAGLKPFGKGYNQAFTFRSGIKKCIGANIIGYIKGKSDEVIVISAHYDHLGKINGKIYYGADDDASGVAAIISLAGYFAKHQPQHTLVFVSFDAEESGLKGSQAFVENPPVPLSKIRLNVNLDMVSHNDKGELYVAGTSFNPQLSPYLKHTVSGIKLLTGHDKPDGPAHDNWTNQGDHGSFHAKGIPFLYFGVEDHKDYHKPTDTFDNINQDFFLKAVESIRQVVTRADDGIAATRAFKNSLISK